MDSIVDSIVDSTTGYAAEQFSLDALCMKMVLTQLLLQVPGLLLLSLSKKIISIDDFDAVTAVRAVVI